MTEWHRCSLPCCRVGPGSCLWFEKQVWKAGLCVCVCVCVYPFEEPAQGGSFCVWESHRLLSEPGDQWLPAWVLVVSQRSTEEHWRWPWNPDLVIIWIRCPRWNQLGPAEDSEICYCSKYFNWNHVSDHVSNILIGIMSIVPGMFSPGHLNFLMVYKIFSQCEKRDPFSLIVTVCRIQNTM